MNYCNKCGTKTDLDAKFCQNCGITLVNVITNTSLDANIKVATTSVTTEKAFKTIGNSFSLVLVSLKKLIKLAIILSILGTLIFGLIFGGFMFYEQKLKKDKQEAIQQIERIIISAQEKSLSSNNEKWVINGKRNPASGKNIARFASIQSDDGLCSLRVEQRIDGDELTSMHCEKFIIDPRTDINVIFDLNKDMYTMNIESFSDSDNVYIPSSQRVYNSHFGRYEANNSYYLSYKDFIKGLLTSNVVAVKITPTYFNGYEDFENPFSSSYNRDKIKADSFWIKFSLNNTSNIIPKLGKEISNSQTETTQESG